MSQFILEGFTPTYKLDRMEYCGGLMLFIREDIPSKLLPNVNPSGNQLEIKKWLTSRSYNPNVGLTQNHTVNLNKNLDFYSSKYENLIVKCDFND